MELVARLLEYTPSLRITPLQACAHSFFNELREQGTRLPNGRELPPLFNFTESELRIQPALNNILIPQSIQQSDSSQSVNAHQRTNSTGNICVSTESSISNVQPNSAVPSTESMNISSQQQTSSSGNNESPGNQNQSTNVPTDQPPQHSSASGQ